MVKEKKEKKRMIASRVRMDIYTFLKNSKRVFHRPVCFTRIWENTLRNRGKERLEKLPGQISAIKFVSNSAAINFCARSS